MPGPTFIPPGFHPLWLVTLVTVLFATLARILRGVNSSGALAGAIVCFVLYGCAGPAAFLLLVLLFLLTWGATRLGYQHKLKLGTAEKKEGRTASQILANVGVAAACAVAYQWREDNLFLTAMCAALAEAAADTVSSEIGQTSSHEARLITTWRTVPAGTNGGISVSGTLAGTAAALLITLAGVFTGLISRQTAVFPFIAACLGMVCDSYLGAILESRKFISNNTVNFLGTLTAVLLIAISQLLL